ncbi:MAG: tryptophan transporter [Clostridium sp.]
MNTRKITISGVLFAAGLIIHQLMPPILGVTPDVQLAVLFIVILINDSFKGAIAAGIVSGIITALTTKLPGAQLPNMIDKIVSCIIMYFVLILLLKLSKYISTKSQGKSGLFPRFLQYSSSIYSVMAIVGLLGTVVSGTVFLISLLYIVGMPPGMTIGFLFITSVIPTSIINLFLTPALYKIVQRSLKSA